jgi:hypothetical protein
MDKENIWAVCEHVYIGNANEVLLKRDKISLGQLCTVILPAEDIQAVYESQLMDLIKNIDIIGGMEILDKKE